MEEPQAVLVETKDEIPLPPPEPVGMSYIEQPSEPEEKPVQVKAQPKSQEQPVSSGAEVAAAAAAEPKKPEVKQELPPQETPQMKAYGKLVNAKAYLKKHDQESSNLYEHLAEVFARLIRSKPENPVVSFEELYKTVFRMQPHEDDTAVREPSATLEAAKKFKALAEAYNSTKETAGGDMPDLLDLANLLEWAGVSLGKEETFKVNLAIKKLVTDKNLKSVRFFGKIFGLEKDYMIVESERGDAVEEQQTELANSEDPKAHKALPKEVGSGVNKYVYWVTSAPGEEWSRLPDATPESIQAARHIRKYLSGDLKRKIKSYPPFPGEEALFLRAQIARISASTVVSPVGYYKFDEEDEMPEGGPAPVVLNTEFEWPSTEALLLPQNWVHHIPYILPQGRTVWVNPNPPKVVSEDAEQDEEHEEPQIEPETGPQILTNLADDVEVTADVPSWSIRVASNLNAKYSPVFLKSNRWPGAVTVGYSDRFVNIYVGYGLKELSRPYAPPKVPEEQKEYEPSDPNDLVELNDPTVAEEIAFEEAQKEKAEAKAEED